MRVLSVNAFCACTSACCHLVRGRRTCGRSCVGGERRPERRAMTAGRIRALTGNAQAKAADATEIVRARRERPRRMGDFESLPHSDRQAEDLAVLLTTLYVAYRRTLANYLRIDRPLDEIPVGRRCGGGCRPRTHRTSRHHPHPSWSGRHGGGAAGKPSAADLHERQRRAGGDSRRRSPLSAVAFAPGLPVTVSAIPRPAPRS